MKTYIKRRISVFLCLLLTVPTILGAIPRARLEIQAASNITLYSYGDCKIAKGTQGFYMGDKVSVYIGGKRRGYASVIDGVTYKSADSSIASVDSKTGLVKPRKIGSTEITVTYKKTSMKCVLEVVSQTEERPIDKKVDPAAKKLVQAYGKGITASNRYAVVTAAYAFSYAQSEYYAEKRYELYRLSPLAEHAGIIEDDLNLRYVSKLNPIGTGGAKLFKVKSVTGKGSVVTAKLSAKVSANQIFAIKTAVSSIFDSKITQGKTAVFPMYVQDKKTGHRYYALATATQGKNTLSIILINVKLKKKTTYKLVGYDEYPLMTPKWTNQGKTTFKAK